MNDSRKAFEEWALSRNYDCERETEINDVSYVYFDTQNAWIGWQAARDRTMHDCIETTP